MTDYRRVLEKFEHESVSTIYVVFEAKEQTPIETTAEHPFRVQGLGWINAGDLRPGQAVETSDGATVVVRAVRPTNRRDVVYNIQVEEFNTYFIGECGLWVHNKNRRPPVHLPTDDS